MLMKSVDITVNMIALVVDKVLAKMILVERKPIELKRKIFE